MTHLSLAEVEEWLDSHPDLCLDYFLRKAELAAINAWLVAHGFLTINDYVSSSRRNSGEPPFCVMR
ncbi:hypothetical protein RUM44_000696 [Polyplax serrata]|uniref:Uncharacterized protein n=1 Tax=Polyplax serrata TaxID=468196 RepID=A0ABR1B925_POLSC